MVGRELDARDDAAWDQLAQSSPQANVFQTRDCLQMLCATDADLRVRRFGCFDGAQLLAAQAVVYHARWGMLLAAPFEFFYASPMLAAAPHCARASRAPKQCDALAALAREIARHFASVEFETHPALKDVRAFLETGWRVRPVYTHIWRVDQIEQTWAAMNREKRRAIKHALAQFAFAHAEDDVTLDAFLAVYRETMAKFSWRPSPKWAAMFRARLRWLTERGCARLYTARDANGKLIGGVVVLLSPPDRTAYLFRQGTAPEFLGANVVPALYWHAARAVAGEMQFVNFGGSPQPSLGRFKDFLGADATCHFVIARRNAPMRLAFLETAMTTKNIAYNFLMRLAHRPLQALWHKKYVAS